LHLIGWTHNDVRWSNVLFTPDNSYFLIDFEYATPFGSKRVKSAVNASEIAQHGTSPGTDFWMLGNMVREWAAIRRLILSERLEKFVSNRLCLKTISSRVPKPRPLASDKMKYEKWLKGPDVWLYDASH